MIPKDAYAAWETYRREGQAAHRDYLRHPSEFNRPIYCIECSRPKSAQRRTKWRCAECERAQKERP